MINREQISFPKILEIRAVDFDSEGFWPKNSQNLITHWSEIREVCLGYWTHSIAIEDHYFHGFRIEDDEKSIWVEEGNEEFAREIGRRYPHEKPPCQNEWKDEDRCTRTFTLWPAERFAEPMYSNEKEHWYSRKKLAFKRTSQQVGSRNSGGCAPSA